MTKKSKDIPGNTLASQALVDREIHKAGTALFRLSGLPHQMADHDVYLKGIKIRVRDDEGTDVLIVVSVDTNDGPKVCFHSADGIREALMGFVNKHLNGQIKWKDDQYG